MNVNRINNLDLPNLAWTAKKFIQSGKNQSSSATGGDLADTVNLSAEADHPGISIPSGGRINVNIDDSLTSRDKQLVITATGGLDLVDPNGVHQVNQLAATIALDRAMGNLTGPVTASYLNKLKSGEQQTSALNRQQADTLSGAGDASAANALRAFGPGITFDVFDKALAFLAQQQ